MSTDAAPGPGRCPLCGGPNGCAMATCEGQAQATGTTAPCWCAEVAFDAAQIQRAAGQMHCLCRRCAQPASPPPRRS